MATHSSTLAKIPWMEGDIVGYGPWDLKRKSVPAGDFTSLHFILQIKLLT